MRVLVCGGRTFGIVPLDTEDADWKQAAGKARREREALKSKLAELRGKGMSVVIHGGCRGADWLAGEWAEWNDIEQSIFLADWRGFGRAAGPIRNAEMLTKGQPDLVVAFAGGVGTQDMVRQATRAGVPVERVAS